MYIQHTLLINQLQHFSPNVIHRSIFSLRMDRFPLWRQVKPISFPRTAAHYTYLSHETFFGADFVYRKLSPRDGVSFQYGSDSCFGMKYGPFAHSLSLQAYLFRLILMPLFYKTASDHDYTPVIASFGHKRFMFECTTPVTFIQS